ncbi:MAG TPA: putative toxin-antitoxin system toxin component, PIN family [Chloroflexi bacterium]|nr:putative toxin-antitoxin system toxin component, PIN family [Chloroflexota bacterium]
MPQPGDESPPVLRAVLDTNVYVSGVILSRGTPFEVLEAWRGQAYILVTSEAIIAEIERVLRYPRIRDRYAVSEQDIACLVESLRADAVVVAGACEVSGVSRDPDDDKFLACALEAQADCIATGDPDLLDLGHYQGVAILEPHEFLERLR